MDFLLTLVLLTPLLGVLALLLVPSRQERLVKLVANATFALNLLLCVPLLAGFDRAGGFQFVERRAWVPSLGASYYLAVDGYSLLLVAMTALLGLVASLASWNAIQHRLKEFYAYLLVTQLGSLGTFMALDFLLFFVFWELVLIPMYFLIGIWGGERRGYASIKFLLYTLIGSVLMLLGGLYLYFVHFQQFGTYSLALDDLLKVGLSSTEQWWVFTAFFLGFAVKVPMWPLHTWLPDAHTEAPTAGSVVLAGVLLKMGTYGFLRFSLPLLPDAAKEPGVVATMAGLSLIAIVYGAFVSLMQKDWKRLVAYSSVSHLGFCTLGIFALNPQGVQGSMLQQVNHGLSTSMLFLIVGVMYERRHTREIAAYRGLFKVMPVLTVFFLIAALSSMGFPPLNGFIGEVTILQGAYQRSLSWALWSALGLLLGAAYILWLFQRTTLGETDDESENLRDLSLREVAVFAPLIVGMFWIGLYPKPFFDLLEKPAAAVLERVKAGGGAQQAGVGR